MIIIFGHIAYDVTREIGYETLLCNEIFFCVVLVGPKCSVYVKLRRFKAHCICLYDIDNEITFL